MLVLSRKKGQKIQISDDVTITITQIKGGNVKLGIEAPRDVKIRRSELVEPTQSQSVQSSNGLIIEASHDFLQSLCQAQIN